MIKNAFKKCIFTFALIIRLIKGTNLLTIKYTIMISSEIESVKNQIEILKSELKFLELLNELKQDFETLKKYKFKTYTNDRFLVDKYVNNNFINYYTTCYVYSVETSCIKSFLELYKIIYESDHYDIIYLKNVIRKINKLNKYLSNTDICIKYAKLINN